MSTTTSENLALRRALADARLRDQDVSQALGVDPKTVQRWLSGRRPQPAHRWALAELVGVHEYDLWPELTGVRPIDRELVATYPHRSAVPRDVWLHMFERAEHQIGILVYGGLFLAEDVELMRLIAAQAKRGVDVRVLLGNPDSAAVLQRGHDEGIDSAMAAKVRNAAVLHQVLTEPAGARIRHHATVLYASVYRADDDMLVNPHLYGIAAAQAPVLHLRRRDDGALFTAYAEAFERVWDGTDGPAD